MRALRRPGLPLDHPRVGDLLLHRTDRSPECGRVRSQVYREEGEGPHHITIQVDDLEATHKMLEGKGIKTFGYSEALPCWKEFYIHPKEAFGTLIQFAEFDPLNWINPGYVPPSYREFVAEQQVGTEEDPIAVRRVAGENRPEIEIRRGTDPLISLKPRQPTSSRH